MHNMRIIITFLFLITVFIKPVSGQEEEEVNVVGFRFLDYGNNLPEDILKAKSIVLVSVPPVSKTSSERGDWKAFSGEAHEYFKKIGIDPVAYVYFDDVFANSDATKAYTAQFIKREIKYIIIISKVILKIKNKESMRYVILITPFSQDEVLIKNGQKAYKDQDKDFEKPMKKIYGITVRKDYVKTNNLIIDNPEYLPAMGILKGRRNQSYPVDLRVDKLAVPKFEETKIPDNRPGGILNNRIAKEIEKANEHVERQNFEIDRLFQNYKWKYELVSPDIDDKELYRNGFLYKLIRVSSTGKKVKEFLGYELNDIEQDYITTIQKPDGSITFRAIPVNAPVHKFYIKSMARDEVYIGESWDADETWQDALKNHLTNLIDKLEKR
jgi:hypothetical protein